MDCFTRVQSSQGSQNDLYKLQIFSREDFCSEYILSKKSETAEAVFGFFYLFYNQVKMFCCSTI